MSGGLQMTTEVEYERWRRGEAPVTECVQDAIRLLREQVEASPAMDRANRYAFAIGVLTASVDEAIRADLLALIRAGEIR
jgi:hypothetical protein